ncbi:hypothetical protein GGX14DRAFT_463554 [Mycena pura]|uniref:Phosphatidylglycerol/phosphatidylinositol transfer protein n=1 Tax=Mycena pura TaxID=153505 RepID=A0AAD6YAA4_9AGAR|nr:hypothetical protein GGX14DRAFT_463554 [Mycena pura]
MKLLTSVVLSAALVASAFAQGVVIGAPADGATVHAGENITVEVDRPNTLTGSTEVAVVIGFQVCGDSPASCPSPDDVMGTILYNGPYNPTFHTDTAPGFKPPYENFTVTVPAFAPEGRRAQLNLAHVTLVGAGQFAVLETRNISLNVV